MEWVRSLPGKIWDAFDTSVRKALEDFAKFVDGREGVGENKSLVGPGKLPLEVLKSLTSDYLLEYDFLEWLANDINTNSTSALAFCYATDTWEGELRDTFIDKISSIKKPGLTKLVVFLNIGKFVFRDDSDSRLDTYITSVTDPKTGKDYQGSHYSLVVHDFNSGISSYCDTYGWRSPVVLGSVMETCVKQLQQHFPDLPQEDLLIQVHEVHNSSCTYETGHRCRHRRGPIQCSTNYPLQTCTRVCGVAIAICGALASYDYPTFESLTGESGCAEKVKYLTDITPRSDFLRVVLIKWYIEGIVEIRDIYRHEGSDIMIYDDPPAKRLKVEVTHEIHTSTTSSSDTPQIKELYPKFPADSDQNIDALHPANPSPELEPCPALSQPSCSFHIDQDGHNDWAGPRPSEGQNAISPGQQPQNQTIDAPAHQGNAQDKLFNKTSISANVQLTTLFGFRWKIAGRKDERKHYQYDRSRSSVLREKNLKNLYVCVHPNCGGSYRCSAVRKVGVPQKCRSFQFISPHTCNTPVTQDFASEVSTYNFNKGSRANSGKSSPMYSAITLEGTNENMRDEEDQPEESADHQDGQGDDGEDIENEVHEVQQQDVEKFNEVLEGGDPEDELAVEKVHGRLCDDQQEVKVEVYNEGKMEVDQADDALEDQVNVQKYQLALEKVHKNLEEAPEVNQEEGMEEDVLDGARQVEGVDYDDRAFQVYEQGEQEKAKPEEVTNLLHGVEEIMNSTLDLTTIDDMCKDTGDDIKNMGLHSRSQLSGSGNFSLVPDALADKLADSDDDEDGYDFQIHNQIPDPLIGSTLIGDEDFNTQGKVVDDLDLTEADHDTKDTSLNISDRKIINGKKDEVKSRNKTDLPLNPHPGPALYIFPEESTKAGRGKKYDIRTWTNGSNSNQTTTYNCSLGSCKGRRHVWICEGTCKDTKTRDKRCCQEVRKRNRPACLFVKYEGTHTCTENTGLNDSAMANVNVKGRLCNSLVDRTKSKYPNLVVVDEKDGGIPEELIGNDMYILRCEERDIGANLQKLINDGRSYKRCTTTNKDLVSLFPNSLPTKVFSLSCKGSMVCNTPKCPFFKRFKIIHQVPRDSAGSKCSSCGTDLLPLTCPAKKIVAYQNKQVPENEIIVKYSKETHTCFAKHKIQETTVNELTEYFKLNPNIKPTQAWTNILSQKILSSAPSRDIYQMVMTQVRPWTLGNIKYAAIKDRIPGIDLAGIIDQFKRCYVIDLPFYGLYLDYQAASSYCTHCDKVMLGEDVTSCSECKDTHVTPVGEFIFITSVESMNTMDEMCKGKTLYGVSCHIDHQPSRTKEFTTFEGVCLDPDLGSVVTLFTVHMKQETEFHVVTAFHYLRKEVLPKYDKYFEPHGFVSDNAGALRNGVKKVFGRNMPHVSDIFHFRQNTFQVLSDAIGSRTDQVIFLKLMSRLQSATSPAVYEGIYKQLDKWIKRETSREKKLTGFIDYWHERRYYWCTGYKNRSVEEHSLAETGNSMMARKGINKNSAIHECLQWELCVYMRHKCRIEELKNGSFVPRSSTRVSLDEKESKRIFAMVLENPVDGPAAAKLVNDVMKSLQLPDIDSDDMEEISSGFFDSNLMGPPVVTSKNNDFRYRDQESSVPLRKPGRPPGTKKKKPKFTDEIECSQSDEEAKGGSCSKSGANKLPLAKWGTMHDRVKKMGQDYSATLIAELSFCVKQNIPNYVNKTVVFDEITQSTSCTCEDFQKKQTSLNPPYTKNCKHVVFVMQMIGIPARDPLLKEHYPLQSEDFERLKAGKTNWVRKTRTDTVENTVQVGAQRQVPQHQNQVKYNFTKHSTALAKAKETQPKWFAGYYPRGKGKAHECSTIKATEKHSMKKDQMCLWIEIGKVHPIDKGKSWAITPETKYFCLKRECLLNPRDSITSFSNYKAPKMSDINTESLKEEDLVHLDKLQPL